MNKVAKIVIIIVIIDAVLLLGYFYFRDRGRTTAESRQQYDWIEVDEYYTPKDAIERFIKEDAESRDMLPIFLKNYGKNTSILRRFKGSKFARPTEAQLKMMINGLEDWKLVDIKFKPAERRDIIQTVLYVYAAGNWKVSDRGSLMK